MRAIFTLGAETRLDYLFGGWRGLSLRSFISLLAISLVQSNNGMLSISEIYRNHEMSGKGTFSYWLGMAFAKLAAERLMDVRWLLHVDKLIERNIIYTTSTTGRRGDLAGRDGSGAWHVIEAKGRSSGVDHNVALRDAKYQAGLIRISGVGFPVTSSGCLARLDLLPITLFIDDPRNHEDEPVQWETDDDNFYEAYYSPFLELLDEHYTETVGIAGVEFDMFPLESEGTNLLIGLAKEVRQNPKYAPRVFETISEGYEKYSTVDGVNGSLGKDGVLLIQDNNIKQMMKDIEQEAKRRAKGGEW
jgi:hypothetical protein